MKISNIKYSYVDSRFPLGTYLGTCEELEIKSDEYDVIVDALKKGNPDYEDIKIMSYERQK